MNIGAYWATFAHVDGNSNNSSKVDVWYTNLNNTASNANWNNDAALFLSIMEQKQNARYDPNPLVKLNSKQATVSSGQYVKAVERIRQKMKSYKNLWDKFISDENIDLAIKNASRGKKDRKSVKKRIENPKFKEQIKRYAELFKNKKHTPKEIYDGIQRKKRSIIVPTFDEQVIHHMVVNILQPIFMRGMYEHSYGSIPKRGAHKGKKAIIKWIKHDGKNCKYVLKMDIRKYFDSIPHDIYLRKLREIIKDRRFMAVLEEITEVIPQGLPLGFYTSQWTANWYLQDLDHYIKEELHATHYIRYMDDMVIFGANKKELHKMRVKVGEYLETELGLTLKNNWQVYRFEYNGRYRFLDFMGFRFYRNRVTLRRSILLKALRKARRIFNAEKVTIHAARQMLSYLGWLSHTSTYGIYEREIKPLVNYQSLKRRLSKYDRRQNGGLIAYGVV